MIADRRVSVLLSRVDRGGGFRARCVCEYIVVTYHV